MESVSSLLDLRYPDFEVIVVNDGSRDGTLRAPGRALRPGAHRRVRAPLPRHAGDPRRLRQPGATPSLLVIDKANGGKADSLNAGINVARKEYFAGIDADSMLERDALLAPRRAVPLLRRGGGGRGRATSCPVNGCTVRRGDLVETRIPRAALARFQTVEYLRAFMAGRVGWATLKSLLIISGAFGVFHRRRVVDAHGYLTRSEHYLKDTVGEDMELVVRLTRGLRESRTPFAMQYAYDANCWTEIPETLPGAEPPARPLAARAARHRHVPLPDDGQPRLRPGRARSPSRTSSLFEVLGPWFEAEGTLVFVASLALGAIGAAAVPADAHGDRAAAASRCRSPRSDRRAPARATSRCGTGSLLVLYALAENFGFRQLMSLLRVRGFVRMLARVGGWGRMERRGFGAAAGTRHGGGEIDEPATGARTRPVDRARRGVRRPFPRALRCGPSRPSCSTRGSTAASG